MKTTKQIAEDCGMTEDQSITLKRALDDEYFVHTPMEEHLAEVIGALYRHIEELEEEKPNVRLEYIRGELRAERVSYGELMELQSLVGHIQPDDVELLEAAGVPEFPKEDI